MTTSDVLTLSKLPSIIIFSISIIASIAGAVFYLSNSFNQINNDLSMLRKDTEYIKYRVGESYTAADECRKINDKQELRLLELEIAVFGDKKK